VKKDTPLFSGILLSPAAVQSSTKHFFLPQEPLWEQRAATYKNITVSKTQQRTTAGHLQYMVDILILIYA